jgi:mannosyl-3-phosphoglycerate phosphatase
MRHASDKKEPRRLIVFTDLDGSLLNHGDYSWEAARPALDRIRELGIPLVICTSKTRQEVEVDQEEIGISGPFIVENGGGIFLPPEYDTLPVSGAVTMGTLRCIPLGVSYARIRSFMENAMKEFPIRGFGDMSVEEISQRTGLTTEKASLAKAREFTEPFVMEHEEELYALERTARRKGLMITKGGRFFHCMGFGNDKGVAVTKVKEILSRRWRESVLSIGFGDSPNDFPMLRQVDIPVLIPHEDGTYEDIDLPGLIKAQFPGSRGWNDTALNIIGEMNGNDKKKRMIKHSA